MTSRLSQFHYLASTVPNDFDFEAEDFDVSQIYTFYTLKVSSASRSRPAANQLPAQHQRTPVSLFLDKMFAQKLTDLALSKADYEGLYVKTKMLANVLSQ